MDRFKNLRLIVTRKSCEGYDFNVAHYETSTTIFQNRKSVLRPVVILAPEIWSFMKKEEKTRSITKRKILNKVYGLERDNATWAIKMNHELKIIL